jgi:dTDP-4-amino-4,6-dideoxygalactose transaminase
MKVPFLSFTTQHEFIKEEIRKSFEDFFDSQNYILGNKVKEFENAFSHFNRVEHCIGVANGLDALTISLKTLDISKGDEVIVPSNTYIATWLAVSAVGSAVVPVEPDKETYNINAGLIEAAITPATKAIIPVHLYGQACEMNKIMEIAKRKNLFVIEDNAQAQGAAYNGKLTGSFGDINATSFYPTKNLGALGDAGAITTDKNAYAETARLYRNYGSPEKNIHLVKGMNSRLDEIQAAVLSIKLKHLSSWNQKRIKIAGWYYEYLKDIKEVILPAIAENATSVYHLFVVRTKERDRLRKYLEEKEISTLGHYPTPPHLQKAYDDLPFKKGQFPLAEMLAETCLSLPLYPGLEKNKVEYVCETIRSFYR